MPPAPRWSFDPEYLGAIGSGIIAGTIATTLGMWEAGILGGVIIMLAGAVWKAHRAIAQRELLKIPPKEPGGSG